MAKIDFTQIPTFSQLPVKSGAPADSSWGVFGDDDQIGEQFNLEDLAADCTQDKVYECMLVSVPLYLVGGIASPPNAVAIK